MLTITLWFCQLFTRSFAKDKTVDSVLSWYPADIRRNNNDIMTSKRRRFDVIMVLLLRHVPAGQESPQRAHDSIITSLWRQNDVATSFWHYFCVVCPMGLYPLDDIFILRRFPLSVTNFTKGIAFQSKSTNNYRVFQMLPPDYQKISITVTSHEHRGVSNRQPSDHLSNILASPYGPLWGKPQMNGGFPSRKAGNADSVSMSCRHHVGLLQFYNIMFQSHTIFPCGWCFYVMTSSCFIFPIQNCVAVSPPCSELSLSDITQLWCFVVLSICSMLPRVVVYTVLGTLFLPCSMPQIAPYNPTVQY